MTAMRIVAVALALAPVAGCAGDVGRPWVAVTEFSTAPGSVGPNLYVTADGRAVLTWFEKTESGHALKLTAGAAGGWSEPVTIRETELFFVNWADFPSFVELADGTWGVHWPEKVAANTYAYHVNLSLSHDDGATWSDPIVPHRDASPMEHGFVSMVPWGDDGAALIWLDGRGMATADGAEEREEGDHGEMSLRYTTVDSRGTLGADVLLDGRTCECCQTSLVRTASGLLAAYRDRSETEIRNIAVVRYENGAWTEAVPVHDDAWRYPGCPVNGPQLAARGDTVVVAWYTAPDDAPRVYAAFSSDGGASFAEPIRVDDGDPLGRVDVEFTARGQAVVAWVERTAAAAEIRARIVGNDRPLPSTMVTVTSDARRSAFPRMARVGDDLLFAWTDVNAEGRIRVARVTGVEE